MLKHNKELQTLGLVWWVLFFIFRRRHYHKRMPFAGQLTQTTYKYDMALFYDNSKNCSLFKPTAERFSDKGRLSCKI